MCPLISCIIPVYNAEQYLSRCINSVLSQDYPILEVVLIDDGSSDGSGAICDAYAKEHKNMQVHHIPNGGASLARKKGVELAQGEYLTFVDSDDYIAPNYVSTLYHLIERYGTKISACGVARTKEGESTSANCDGIEQLLTFDELMPRFFKYEYWGLGGGLYHRSVFNGLDFPKATLGEDYYVKMQMFCRERKQAVTDTHLYYYEYHPTSLSHTKLSERAFEEFENVKAVYDYTLEHCPEYKEFALSNVVETAVKLKLMQKGSKYDKYYADIDHFLYSHRTSFSRLTMLNRNVRLLARGLVVAPGITRWISKRLA